MSKPDFQSMSRKDLHVYVLTHREDQEAFYAYVDKLHAEATWIEMPALDLVGCVPHFSSYYPNDKFWETHYSYKLLEASDRVSNNAHAHRPMRGWL